MDIKKILVVAVCGSFHGALGANLDWLTEAGCQGNSRRGDTPINPGGRLLEPESERCRMGVKPTVYIASERFELNVSGWAQAEYHNEQETQSDFIWQTSFVSWAPSNRLTLDAGGAVIEQGPGYAWNPVNPFFDIRVNERDRALKFHREADPKLGVRYLTDSGQWSFSWVDHAPYPDISDDRVESYLLTLDHFFSTSQLTLNLANLDQRPFVGIAHAWTVMDSLEIHSELSYREGAKTLQPVITEGGFFRYDNSFDKNDYWNGLVGFQYTFSNSINILGEVFYQEDGFDKHDWRDLQLTIANQQMQLQTGGPMAAPAAGFLLQSHDNLRLLRQYYGFARVAFPDMPLGGELAFFSRINLDDDSHVSGFYYTRDLFDAFTLQLSGQVSDGETYSEGFWIPVKQQLSFSIHYRF